MKKYLVILSTLIVFTSCGQQKKKEDVALKTKPQTYKTEMFVNDLSIPWGMTWLPEGSMLITEKDGRLIHFKDGKKIEIANMPAVYVNGQGGLLDIKLHPNYNENGWIYMTYASEEGPGKGGHTALMRCKLDGDSLTNIEMLYKASPNSSAGQHFGSRIEFDKDGYVYFTIGERGDREVNPQDITRDGGKVYRLKDDGSIPEDNPFFNEPNAKKAIYTYGNRNPQGMAIHPETGEIWMHEHGPKGGDEINIVKKGANYGWMVVTYGVNYSGTEITDQTEKEGIEPPIYYWVPSIAPSGMAFVTSDKYPEWKNKLLVGSLKFAYVELLTLDGEKVTKREKIAQDIGRVRNVKIGPDGLIYIAVEGQGIYRLIPE